MTTQSKIADPIEGMMPTSKDDKRATARMDENQRIIRLQQIINNPESEIDIEISNNMKVSYYNKFKKNLVKIEVLATNKDHCDLLGFNDDDTTTKIEEKGSIKGKITEHGTAWENSVQCLNDVPQKYPICMKYAELYYEHVIKKINWKELLDVDEEIPNFEQWLTDAFRCGDPKTEFVKKIKSNCRLKYGEKTSFTGLNETPNFREIVNQQFQLHDREKEALVEIVSERLFEVLNEKDIYLQTSGNIDDNTFKFAWKEHIEPPIIYDVILRKEKDLWFDFVTEEGAYDFKGILRWGKGAGFTNIRFDIR